ncbi:MAG: transcriptional regulator [archaeon]
MTDRIATSEALSLIADDRRRRLLLDLLECDPDEDVRVRHGSEETGVAVQLYHNHLPRLAAVDVITWNSGTDDAWNDEGDVVGRGDAFDELRPFVERLDQYSDELPGDWRDESVDGLYLRDESD